MSFEYQERYKYLSNACLNVTDACNLACKYCFVEQHPHFMTLDIAKQAVDFLISNLRIKKENGWAKQSDKANITFFGGEPTLLWDEIIVPLVDYTEKTYPNEFSFNMTTNGTLLNKERIDFLYEHKIYILLSIDGVKETQDINRPCQNGNKSSFDLVFPNIPYLLEKFPNTTFRATIDQSTVAHTFENFVFANYMGFRSIYMMPNGRDKWAEENKTILKSELEKIFQFMANYFISGQERISFLPMNDSFNRVLTHDILSVTGAESKIAEPRSPVRCGMGTGFGSIGYDGRIYGCQEQNSKDLKNIFFIGDIFNGIDIEKHKILLEEYTKPVILKSENEALCESCKLRNICSTFACPSSSWDLFGSFFIDNEIHCLWNQWLFENAIVLMYYFNGEENDNNKWFKKYLLKECNYDKAFPNEEKRGECG